MAAKANRGFAAALGNVVGTLLLGVLLFAGCLFLLINRTVAVVVFLALAVVLTVLSVGATKQLTGMWIGATVPFGLLSVALSVVATAAVAGFLIRFTPAYVWQYGTDVTASIPTAQSFNGTNFCEGRVTYNCPSHWQIGDQDVSGTLLIDGSDLNSNSVSARALGGKAISYTLRPAHIGREVTLGRLPSWTVAAALGGQLLIWGLFVMLAAARERWRPIVRAARRTPPQG
jgi:hypothetical protein